MSYPRPVAHWMNPMPQVGRMARLRWSVSAGRDRIGTRWRSSSVVEQGTHKPLAGGSNPPSATTSSRDALAALVADGAHAARIPRSAHLLLAVSGGADSTALLHGAA